MRTGFLWAIPRNYSRLEARRVFGSPGLPLAFKAGLTGRAEELVAEIASAFLSAELGVTQDTRADHAQYLAQWLELMKADSRAIFTAAARASEAVAYLKKNQAPA